MCRRLILFLCLFLFLQSCSNDSNPAGPPGIPLTAEEKSVDDIKSMWEIRKPRYSGDIYSIVPSVSRPYNPGQLHSEFLLDGLNMINFCRYLADLPADCVLDPEYNEMCQYGAVLLAASAFSHTPPQLNDMSDRFYETGYQATSSSNIGAGYPSLAAAVQSGWMSDRDARNIDRVGHRRWILNPSLKRIGFGFAPSHFSLMYVFDKSRKQQEVHSER